MVRTFHLAGSIDGRSSSHKDRDPESELRKHNEMAHTHDHESPIG